MGNDRSSRSWSASVDTLLPIFISLYLVLIALFFVLNRYADIEAVRQSQALESVSATFSRFALPRPSERDDDRDTGTFDSDPSYLAAAADLMSKALPVAEARGGPQTDQLTIIVPTEALFDSGRVTVRRDRRPVLDSLAALAARAPSGTRRDMRIYLGSGTTHLQPQPEGAGRIALLRSGALARALAETGFPAGGYGIGLTPGRADQAAFVFLSRPELGSRLGPEARGGGR
ncbi:hypothetical protein EV659_101475 [Rhodothalassium salexigens DSM 2132]|uniref:Motility protein B-like N-terminal domain-containing protein n=1 Tax=Rhodothalassium salexigens DSM 2132 TaxID=1188247 RepID=A0A4R2PU46_RHOSA|nr:hypothetical protein [Rhodothalassium salexigens]MBB4210404.1 hypothetical protein [Rhodothalassium salexigens DSM 2132]MBK1638605.1 hypothetical protein [Rhodothalassium salexigens DSM 2132]TCP38568.1 hypothetical protein EV659_101475 [Rhodothalassium salexigens DSM 2132]